MPIAEVPNLVLALPEIFMVTVAMALLMLGVFQKKGDGAARAQTTRWISYLGVIALVLALLLLSTVAGGRLVGFNGLFVSDSFAVFFKVLVLTGAAMAIILSPTYLEHQGIAKFEYAVLILLATTGMMVMISANDLLSLYLGLEIQSLSLYVIAAFQRDDSRSTEAGLKYFVLGALASGMLLYGSSLVYGFAGTTNFDLLAAVFLAAEGSAPALGVIVGLVFILAGMAFKISAVPFHMWTPDVYEGAPTPVTAFFSVAPKIAALALLIRIMIGPFGELADQWRQIVVFLSIASMVLGAFAAINQKNIKRMMAYSSIGHVGYALIGLAAGTQAGIQGIMIYMAIYLFMNLGAFACILGMRRGERMLENIDDLAGLSKTHPMMAMAMAIFMFSMAGIPPLAGFFGKLYIFLAAIDAELFGLAITGVLASVVAAFYYLRIIKIMYFEQPGEPLNQPIGWEIAAVLLMSGLIISFFFVYPAPILAAAAAASATIF